MAQSPSSPSATTNNAAKDDVVGLNGDLTFTIADLLANDPGGAAKNDVSKQFFFGNIADYAANQIVNGIPTVAAQRAYLLAHHIESNAAFTEFTIKTDATDIQYMVQMGNKGTWSQADVDVRHAPTAEAFTNTVEEDKSISGNVKGADIDGDSLTYSLKGTAPAGLTFNSDGSYTFDASGAEFQKLAAGEQKAIQVEYVVNDGHGGTATSTLTITVTGMNDAAKISGEVGGDFDETNEAQVYTGKLEVTDADHDQATFQQQTDVAGKYGSFSIEADGSWNYTMNDAHNEFKPGTDYTDSITVNTADGTAQVISVTIHGANDAPVLTGTPATLAAGTEDTSYTISKADLLAGYTDVENDALSVSGLSSNDGTWAKNADDSWTFKPAGNFNGQVDLSYHVTDGNGGDVTASQTLSLAAVNDAPTAVVLSNTVISTSENGGSIKVADIAVTDVDSGTNVLSLSGVDAASFSIVDGAGGGKELHFNGGANFETKAGYDVMVNVNDASVGGNPDASQNFHLAITDVNEAPSVALANTLASTAENGGEIKVADIVVSDDALGTNVVSLSGTDAAAFKIVGTELHFIGGADFETQKSYDVTVNVNDASVGGNPDASQNFHLAITDVVEADSDTTNDYDVRDVNGNLQVTSGGATGNGHTFNGSQQADTIVATNDPINGDQVNAKDGGDTLYGRGGNDDLQGQNGNDTIYGGSGDDNITGGNGADHLWGGSGNDKFVFTTADDSLFNAPDTIHDFHHGFDRIDVHSINSGGGGTGDFTFGGTVATAHGVWFTEGGGNTTVHFDTNGNTGNDEMTITLTGTGLGLTASDFIL